MAENTSKPTDNYFTELYNIDVRDKVKAKNGLSYLSWAAAWAEVKKKHPNATYTVYEQNICYPLGVNCDMKPAYNYYVRPWFDDGTSGWVKVSVTINDIEYIERLPIMDYKNQPIPADKIRSTDANKAIQRALTKACARHGLGLYIYEGEDLPEESKELQKLREECYKLSIERAKLSADAKKKVEDFCKSADENANGDARLIGDIDTLKKLKIQLMGIRVVKTKAKEE